ncbi:MAG TPA: DinB family protein [Candidatus Acidoferrales bacterium]|nr:DinB family protein [Candidatus Acidoferrales bacterium]
MKKAALFLSAVLCLSTIAFAQSLSPEDRDKGVKYFEQTRQGIIDATKGLSDAQWKFKSAPDRWSVAETLEHITLAEDYLYENGVQKALTGTPSAPDRDYQKTDAAILAMVPDRSHKAQAPGPLVPTGRWSPADTLDHFLKSRQRNIDALKSLPAADLRSHLSQGPLGPVDAYEWFLFISAHSDRHTKQILEVKADPNFPKN